MPRSETFTGRALRNAMQATLSSAAGVGRRLQRSEPDFLLAGDVRYADGPRERVLDIHDALPSAAPPQRPPACVLFLHGGGFQILDKRTHWVFTRELSRAGLMVFSANYRLAPANPFPAAAEDAALAYTWVCQHAARFGGDPSRILVAGDSAGANLALGLCLSTSHPLGAMGYRAPGVTWAMPQRPPTAALLFSGFLQVSQPERFPAGSSALQRIASGRLRSISATYAAGHLSHPLLDPLLAVERGLHPGAPVFASTGEQDPVCSDTLRLARALGRLGADYELDRAPQAGHVFQTLYWQAAAQHTWSHVRAFLAAHDLAPADRCVS